MSTDELYISLEVIRNGYALQKGMKCSRVMTDMALYMITVMKPDSAWQFREIKGIGSGCADDLASLMIPIIKECIGNDEIARRNHEKFILEMEGIIRPEREIKDEDIPEEDRELYELLRKIRLDLARDAGWPPYCIMSNKALRAVAAEKPTTVGKFGEIPGISARRDESGELFVSAILEYMAAR